MKHWKMTTFILCALFIGFSFLTPSANGQAKAIELKYSIFFPAPAPQTAVADAWGKEIEKRTNGRVKVVMFPGGTLTPAPQCYDGVVKGISDIGMSVFAYTRGKFPMIEVADLPLGMKTGLTATKLVNEFNEKFKPKELDEVKVMYLHGHGPGILHTKKEVAKLEDLKGMKNRCTGLAAKIVTNAVLSIRRLGAACFWGGENKKPRPGGQAGDRKDLQLPKVPAQGGEAGDSNAICVSRAGGRKIVPENFRRNP